MLTSDPTDVCRDICKQALVILLHTVIIYSCSCISSQAWPDVPLLCIDVIYEQEEWLKLIHYQNTPVPATFSKPHKPVVQFSYIVHCLGFSFPSMVRWRMYLVCRMQQKVTRGQQHHQHKECLFRLIIRRSTDQLMTFRKTALGIQYTLGNHSCLNCQIYLIACQT